MFPYRLKFLILGIGLSLLAAPDAWARKMRMIESMPAADAYVDGRNAQYSVRFDGPVDHRTSRLWIMRDGRMVEAIPVLLDAAPNVLFGSAPQLSAGRYELRWSAGSAPDGEVTEGSLGFTVRP